MFSDHDESGAREMKSLNCADRGAVPLLITSVICTTQLRSLLLLLLLWIVLYRRGR